MMNVNAHKDGVFFSFLLPHSKSKHFLLPFRANQMQFVYVLCRCENYTYLYKKETTTHKVRLRCVYIKTASEHGTVLGI